MEGKNDARLRMRSQFLVDVYKSIKSSYFMKFVYQPHAYCCHDQHIGVNEMRGTG